MTVIVDDNLVRRAIEVLRAAVETDRTMADDLREVAGGLEAALDDATPEIDMELTEDASAEVVAAGLAALEDARTGRLRTLEQVDATVDAALSVVTHRLTASDVRDAGERRYVSPA